MSKPYKDFEPKWYLETPPKRSYRSIFKWGDPSFNKVPKENLYKMMKEIFHLTDDDFKQYAEPLGLEEVKLQKHCALSDEVIAALQAIVGKENVSTDDYDRLSVAYGKTMFDLLRLRKHIADNVPDCVVYPSDKTQVEKIVQLCSLHKIPLYVYGGGSSVTRGVEPVNGGISLDMRRHFNKVIEFNEIDQTITVQAGISGPDLENALRNAPKLFGAKRAYTCGHFPQSFEYSSVGGWTVTRGAGQNSTYYGKIEDIVIAQEYATPTGVVKTEPFPARATGPDVNHIMMGSEGAFGALDEAERLNGAAEERGALGGVALMHRGFDAGAGEQVVRLDDLAGRGVVVDEFLHRVGHGEVLALGKIDAGDAHRDVVGEEGILRLEQLGSGRIRLAGGFVVLRLEERFGGGLELVGGVAAARRVDHLAEPRDGLGVVAEFHEGAALEEEGVARLFGIGEILGEAVEVFGSLLGIDFAPGVILGGKRGVERTELEQRGGVHVLRPRALRENLLVALGGLLLEGGDLGLGDAQRIVAVRQIVQRGGVDAFVLLLVLDIALIQGALFLA